MSHPEHKRRKDNCVSCKEYKPIKAKNMCQNCWSQVKYRTRPRFFLQQRYTQIRQRCTNKKQKNYELYKRKLNITREDFINKFINCKKFKQLYKEWQESNFCYKKVPSVDRIDVDGDYTIDNIQILTHSQNCRKDQKTRSIVMLDKENNYIKTFEAGSRSAKDTNIPWANIWKVCNKQRKTAGGYKFMYKEDYENL